MEPSEKIHEYSESVCGQIRWKKAHSVISKEIENHLIDQRDAYIANGADEITATDNAIFQMGDPVVVGTQLDRIHRPRPQWTMILLATILLFGGIILRAYINYGLTPKELISAFIGLGFMTAAYLSDFTLIGKYPKTVYFSILALSIAALLISPTINGRAYYAGFMPLLFPLGFAAVLYVTRDKGYLGIILCGMSFLLPAFFSLLVRSISGFALYTVTGLIILSFAIAKRWFRINRLFGCLLVYIPAAITLLLVVMRSWNRLRIALDPSSDPARGGWVGIVIRSLLDGSKLFGRGNMPSEYAMLGFPLPQDSIDTDFLLTYLIFKFGWITFIAIMSMLLFFIIRGFMLCFRQKSCLGLVVSLSVMLTFTMQVIGYVIANLGFLFSSPISLDKGDVGIDNE
jgi:cell division protein FtsW (lipid II flippase)